MNNWKQELQAQVQHSAEREANLMAEEHAIKFMQDLCAEICKAAGKVHHVPTEKFKAAFETVYVLIRDAAHDRLFKKKYDELVRKASREKAIERRRRKAEAEAFADTEDTGVTFPALLEDAS